MQKRNFLVSLDDGGAQTFHLTLREAGDALAKAGMNGQVVDIATGTVVLGRGSGMAGIGAAMYLDLPFSFSEGKPQ